MIKVQFKSISRFARTRLLLPTLQTCIRTFGNEQESWEQRMYDSTSLKGNNLAQFYDEFSAVYDSKLGKYGWLGPQICGDLLVEYGKEIDHYNDENYQNMTILDCGCGTGLVGESLYKCGFKNIIGCDISPQSLQVSESKQVYKQLCIANLEDFKLNFDCDENSTSDKISINAIVSMGVLTHIDDKGLLFERWSNIIENNGLIIVSHREDMLKEDIGIFENMEKHGIWKRLYLSEPIIHNPNSGIYGDNIKAQFYVAKVTK